MVSNKAINFGYMPYLDGIRALAVGGVVLFHLGIEQVHGGFTGVDAFYVLSGFLITLIIEKQNNEGNFSFIEFYVRRARRLLPALFAVLLFVLVVSALLLSPEHFEATSRSAIYAILSASNINFWLESDYFSGSKFTMPLLHTWSLGVEEQFYIVWPAILVGLLAIRKRIVLISALIALTILSFWAMIHFVDTLPNGVFYLSPFRAWQFSAGAIVALLWSWKGRAGETLIHPRVDVFFTLAGGALLGYTFFTTSSNGYPGYAALSPTIGTLLLIIGGRNLVSNIVLTNPVADFFGKTSYSIYLWHWPIIVFLRYYYGYSNQLTPALMVVAVSLSVLMGWLSYKFLETPLRRHWTDGGKNDHFAVPAGVLALALILMFCSVHVWVGKGWDWRISNESQELVQIVRREQNAACYTRANRSKNICWVGTQAKKADFIVLGDSHARALTLGLDPIAKETKSSGVAILQNGQLPFRDVTLYHGNTRSKFDFFEPLENNLKASGANVVVMNARYWLFWTMERPAAELDQPVKQVGRNNQKPKDVKETQENFKYGLDQTLSWMKERGVHLIIVGAVPYQGVDLKDCFVRPTLIMSVDHLIRTCEGISRKEALESIAEVNTVLADAAEKYDATFVNPADIVCPQGMATCMRTDDTGRLIYMDDDHLGRAGADMVSKVVWNEIERHSK
tara:strand:- start:35529 stop:37565 length:2037 start_codon:yes stop_codon:yes gene_type:complete